MNLEKIASLSLILLLLPLGNGCGLFLGSTLGKFGLALPALVEHQPQSENVQIRGQVPATPVGTPTGQHYEMVPPSDGQNGGEYGYGGDSRYDEHDPWRSPTGTNSSGQSLNAAIPAQRESQYRSLAETTKYDPNKPWLQPLPPQQGRFATREISELSGETAGFGPGFEPISKIQNTKIELEDWEKEEDPKFDWGKFDPVNVATNIRNWMGMGPDERKAATYMEAGYAIIRANPDFSNVQKNIEAAKLFEKAAKRWPDSVLEEDALFLAAECYFFSDQYAHASKDYEKLVARHKGSKYMDTSVVRLFRIGRYWERLCDEGTSFVNVSDKKRPVFDTFGNMRKAYEAIYMNDPTGPMGDKAIMALAGAYMNRGRNPGDSQFAEAAMLYAALPDINARSEYIAQARKLELLARSMTYAGAHYDSKGLEEATALADQTLRQYGGELGAERENILDLKETLNNQKAERLWETGLYWEKKMAYSSACYYYRQLVQEYPSSIHVQAAEERLARLSRREDMDDHMKWLKSALIPGSNKMK
ncbi:MAG: tetratricopeptide repeat protein [Thermoguttaceae bacterium]